MLIVGNPIFYLGSFLVRLIEIDGSRYSIMMVHSSILFSWLEKIFQLFLLFRSFHLFEVLYFSYYMLIRCGVVCVRPSSLFALR